MPFRIPVLSVAAVVLVLAGIAGYNIWAYNCGYCALQDMKAVGPQVKGVGIVIVATFLSFLFLRFRRTRNTGRRQCRCGVRPGPGWNYCPDCGSRL